MRITRLSPLPAVAGRVHMDVQPLEGAAVACVATLAASLTVPGSRRASVRSGTFRRVSNGVGDEVVSMGRTPDLVGG